MSKDDESLSPGGRLFVQPGTDQIINCVLGLQQPLGYDAARSVVSNSLMIHHPRFSSILVTDHHGREYWRKIELEIDRHIILRSDRVSHEEDDDEAAINEYLADLSVSRPLSRDKPLWEIHLLEAHKCVVVRIHHGLGDGISLMSLMLTLTRKLHHPEQTPTIQPLLSSSSSSKGGGWKILKMICDIC